MARAFPKDAVIARVNAEPAIMLGAGRALVLQLAHPHVAAGVAEHSDFQHNPFKRLQGTLEAVYTMVYGSAELADGVGRRVQWIHTFVRSDTYEANDPKNLMWVHATLLDTALRCYEDVVGPLSPSERETYYQEMTIVAERFGCPRDAQPATYADFVRYFDDTVAAMEVNDQGRRLVRDVLEPRLPLGLHVPLRLALTDFRRATLGATPVAIREQLGYDWTARDQAAYERIYRLARWYHRVMPRPLRVGPAHLNGRLLLWQARRHVKAFEEKMARRAAPVA